MRESALPRGLAAGLWLMGGLVVAAVTAPLLATDLPWIERGPDGLGSPALRGYLGLGPDRAGGVAERVVLRAPIPYHPARQDFDAHLEAPSGRHWLGTDGLGRDLAARTLHGARVSLVVGLLAALLALAVGLPLGALAGYAGGWWDAAVSRLVETMLCFPTLLLALAILATGWQAWLPDVLRIGLVLGLTGWIPVTRYLRAEFLKLRGSDLLAAARATGAGHLRIVLRHLLPSALAPVLVTAAFAVAGAIVLEAALSFLGLGVAEPTATWGRQLREARDHVDRAWWLALFPGIALFLTVLTCNLIGEGVRDLLDPRSRR